jgi:hypothetical protein
MNATLLTNSNYGRSPAITFDNGVEVGGQLFLFNKNDADYKGGFLLRALDTAGAACDLLGRGDGSLSWRGNSIDTVVSSGSNFIRYMSGLQICWGAAEVSSQGTTYVNFPQAFSHSVSAVISPIGSGPDVPGCYASTTTLNINCGSITSPVYWIAIGYWK